MRTLDFVRFPYVKPTYNLFHNFSLAHLI